MKPKSQVPMHGCTSCPRCGRHCPTCYKCPLKPQDAQKSQTKYPLEGRK